MHPCDRLRSLLSYRTPSQTINHILTQRNKNGSGSLGYLYGANIIGRKLLTDEQSVYRSALENLDCVCVDGIALQSVVWLDKGGRYPNCNGTNLLPMILQQARTSYPHLGLVLYGTTAKQIKKTHYFLEQEGYTVIYAQDGFHEFDRTAYEQAIQNYKQYSKILIIGRSTVTHAIQEERWYHNRDRCHNEGLLVCLQGGIFEHSSFGGNDTRAPRRIQTIKAERIRRLCINPSKNWKKVRYSFLLFVIWFGRRLHHSSSQ